MRRVRPPSQEGHLDRRGFIRTAGRLGLGSLLVAEAAALADCGGSAGPTTAPDASAPGLASTPTRPPEIGGGTLVASVGSQSIWSGATTAVWTLGGSFPGPYHPHRARRELLRPDRESPLRADQRALARARVPAGHGRPPFRRDRSRPVARDRLPDRRPRGHLLVPPAPRRAHRPAGLRRHGGLLHRRGRARGRARTAERRVRRAARHPGSAHVAGPLADLRPRPHGSHGWCPGGHGAGERPARRGAAGRRDALPPAAAQRIERPRVSPRLRGRPLVPRHRDRRRAARAPRPRDRLSTSGPASASSCSSI